jgi:hypothetical protein
VLPDAHLGLSLAAVNETLSDFPPVAAYRASFQDNFHLSGLDFIFKTFFPSPVPHLGCAQQYKRSSLAKNPFGSPKGDHDQLLFMQKLLLIYERRTLLF